jgi:GT2 family glycosyltransferase/ADP-heptose:LPS heptosyltransferase
MNLVVITRDSYGNNRSYEWLRTWRFRPGCRWLAHEPPQLCRQNEDGKWVDLTSLDTFRHEETESHGLIFQHFAYATESQSRFKEIYYGYKNAVSQWQRLQEQKQFPVWLKDYFPWVKDDAQVNTLGSQGIRPLVQKNILNEWRFHPFLTSKSEPSRILWIRPDSIGDNVLAASMLPYIRQNYPNARITIVCQTHIAELYEVCPFVDDIISFDRIRTLQDEEYRNCLVQRLQAVNADLALNSVYSRESLTDLLTIASNAKQKVGLYGNLSRISADLRDQHNRLYTNLFPSEGENKPELERHKDFLAALGLPIASLQPVIWITPDDEKFADNFFRKNDLSPEKTLILFAGAQVWVRLYEGYGTALSKICQENGFRVVALGANHEYAINQQNLDQIGGSSKINGCGKTTIRQAAAILKRSRLAVGAETGLAHIACAVGTPNVILLGGGHFGRFMPYSPFTSIVCLPLECFGCDWKCKYPKPHCVLDVDPDVIGEATRQTLEQRSERPRLFVQPQEGWNPSPGQPQWKMFDRLLKADSVEKKYVSQIPSKNSPLQKGVPAEKERLKYQMSPTQKKDSPESRERLGMGKRQKSRYLVTTIVSTYNSEEFIRECLTDLVNQTIADQLEIIVVDAASPQNERAIIEEFQKKHKNITYIKTEKRVGVYAAWNMAIKTARGEYITPFSTNDRLAKNAYQIMAETLDRNPDVVLVYGDSYVTVTPHETFENHTRVGAMAWPDYSYEDLLQNCGVGPHPMWRKSIHEKIGYFDESLIAIGDQDFWLRIGKKYKLLHIPVFTGLYWATTESLSGNKQVALPEIVEVHKRHRDKRLDQPNSQTIHDSPNSSIIIPTYNNLGFTRECLDAIRQHTRFGGYEIVVVDNGSTDGTAEFLEEEQAAGRLRALFNGHNLGFAKACNAGAKISQGDYLIFLNNDTKVTSGWLEELIKCAQKDQKVGVVGAKLLYPDDTIQHAGVVFSNAKSVYHIYRSFDKDHPAVNKEREFQAVTAACVLLKKQVFFEAGMFDERYQNGFEDIDLCLKVREKGYKVIYNPRSLVYHFEGKTAGRFDQEKANAKLLGSLWSDRIISDEEKYYEEDGLALEVLGKTGRQRAIRLHDSNENPYWTEAVRRRGKGAYKEAVKYYKKALRLNPYDFRNMLIAGELGEIYETIGEYAEAEALYRELANSMPSPLPYLQLGRVQRKMRNYEEAIKNLNQALKPRGREACDWEFMYYCKLGMLYKKKKRFDQAIESLEKAKETIRA